MPSLVLSPPYNMRFVLTAQAWVVVLRLGRPAAQTLGRYKAENNDTLLEKNNH